jgi:hypothetical protein
MFDRNWEVSATDLEAWNFEREVAQNEIQVLREQIRSLEQILSVELEEKQDLEQELHYTHKDLAVMNQEIRRLYAAQQLTFEQANLFAKTLVNEQSVAKALTKLLSAIYGIKVLSEELPSQQKINSPSNLLSQSDLHNFHSKKSERLRVQYLELGSRFIMFKAHFSQSKTQLTNPNNMQKKLEKSRRLQSLSQNRQQLEEVVQQLEEHIQQSQEYIKESKTLIENQKISFIHETNSATGIVARQKKKVEQQAEIVNKMQKKVDEQKSKERKVREETEN